MEKKFKTIKDLVEFVESIPEDKWAKGVRNDGNGRHCFLGHLDTALGDPESYEDRSIEVVEKLIPEPWEKGQWELKIVNINNNSENPKEGVLDYLKQYLEQERV